MPIKPENRARYPKDWKRISEHIRFVRAANKCEVCGIDNYAIVKREKGFTKIVLTVAHLDHQPENCDESNLKAMCQKCHLAYDKAHHLLNSSITRKTANHARQ